MFDFGNVKEVKLSKGAHDSPEHGMCFMEMAAWFAGEEHSDKPECVSPALGRLGIALNDCMDAEARDRTLKPMIPHVVGTTDADAEVSRVAYICLRAFNYTAGMVVPEFFFRYGPARSVGDAYSMGEEIARRFRGDNYGGYGYGKMSYSNHLYGNDEPRKREMVELLTRVCRESYDKSSIIASLDSPSKFVTRHRGDLDCAIRLFVEAARFIPDWSAAIDTLREAINLGRHEGFDVSVNLEKRHKELAKLPAAKPKAPAMAI